MRYRYSPGYLHGNFVEIYSVSRRGVECCVGDGIRELNLLQISNDREEETTLPLSIEKEIIFRVFIRYLIKFYILKYTSECLF